LASRRRRRKTIGKVVSDVERRVRVVEKRPGAKRIKRNVVTAEKIQYRAIVAKNIVVDGVTPNEVSFGTTVVSDTEPTEYLKEGTTWVDPDTGVGKVYDPAADDFVDLAATDSIARTTADGKNTIYAQTAVPTGGTYKINDIWFDTDDGNKLYTWSGSAWISIQDTAIVAAANAATAAQNSADGKNTIYRQTTVPTGGTYVAGDTWFDTDGDNAIYRYALGTTATVSNKALTNNVATLTTSAAHSFTPGESIVVTSVDATFNGTYTVISVPTTTTLTYAKTATNVSSAASSGTITSSAGWKAIVLGNNAIVSISANKLTAGTIDAGVITVSNLNAGNISTGTLAAARIAANSLDVDKLTAGTLRAGTVYTGDIVASQITAGTIAATIEMTSATVTGGLIRTSATGERIEITSSDQINFYNSSGVISGRVSPYSESGYDSGLHVGDGSGLFSTGLYVSSDFVHLAVDTSGSISFLPTGIVTLDSNSLLSINSESLLFLDAALLLSLSVGSTALVLDGANTYLDVSTPVSTSGLRNIEGTTSLFFTPSTDTSGGVGDVMLVYTA